MGVNIYFPALSSNTFTEGPSGYYSFPITLTENPPGSGLYDIPGYLVDEGGGIYSIPLDLLGAAEAGTSNIKQFSVQEDATPIEPSSSFGGVGQIQIGLDDFEDAPRLIGQVVLTDGSRGKTSGNVKNVTVTDGALQITADSVLGLFNTDRTASPFTGTLRNAIQYYCDLVGVQNDVFVDTTVASRSVVYPGWVGNVWVHMKQLLAKEQVEMALVFDRVYVRPLRQLIANQNKMVSSGWSIDNSNAAKTIEVYYYNNTSGINLEVYPLKSEDPSIYSVNAGETITVTQQLNASLTLVNQPVATDFVNNTSYAGTAGVYSVVGNDNKPVTAAQWNAQGGKVVVRITDDPSIIEIDITGASMPDYSPYRIAMSAGASSDYNSLHITGTGVVWDKKMITLTTGATDATTSTKVGVTVDNPYISTLQDAYNLGVKTAQAYAGINYTINGTAYDLNRNGQGNSLVQATIADFNAAVASGTTIATFNTTWAGQDISDFNEYWDEQVANLWENQLFGNAPGARVLEKEANFRVTSATTTEGTVQFNASLDTLVKDFNDKWPEGGTTVTTTNMATNPSFETAGSAVVVRTNLAADPRATAYHSTAGRLGYRNTRWFGPSGGAGAYTLVTGAVDGPAGFGISTYARKTWTTAPVGNNGDTGFEHSVSGTSGFPVTAGQVYTFSSYMRPSTAKNFEFSVQEYNGATQGARVRGVVTFAAAGAWTRISMTYTVPASGVTHLILISDVGASLTGATLWAVGDTLDATGLLVELSTNYVGSYFDGAGLLSVPDTDLTAAWTGTANASTSTLSGVAVASTSTPGRVGIQSSQWSSTGTKSLRIIPGQTTNNDTFIDIRSMFPSPVTYAGQTMTILGKIRLAAPQTGTLIFGVARGFRINTANTSGSGDLALSYSSTAPNTAGVYEVRATFTMPSDVLSWNYIRFYNGANPGNGDVWWDDVMLVPGVYTGPYFSGATTDTHINGVTTDYAWTGTANASTSTRTITTNDYRISDFNAQFAGMTMKDFAVVPLRKDY